MSVRFDMLHVFSIHNEVLQNACSLHISLDSPATCINNSAIAKRFQGKALPGACCQNEVSEHYSFLSDSLIFPPSLCLSHTGALSCTLSFWSPGGIRPLDQLKGICIHTLIVHVCFRVERGLVTCTIDKKQLIDICLCIPNGVIARQSPKITYAMF